MGKVLASIIILLTLVAVGPTPVAAQTGSVELAIDCTSNPETARIMNHTDATLDLSTWTLGSLVEPSEGEPFSLSGSLDPGASITFEIGSNALENILSQQLIFANNVSGEGARMTTPFGTLDVLCSEGTGTLQLGGQEPPPPSSEERPLFQNPVPAPFSTVEPGAVRLAVTAYADTDIQNFTFELNGEPLQPEVGGPTGYMLAAFTEQDLSAGVYTVTAEAVDAEGDAFRAQWDFVVAANANASAWFTAAGQPRAGRINATMRSLVESMRWHLYGQSWDGQPHDELPTHAEFAGQAEPLEPWVTETTFDQAATTATLKSLVEVFRWHFWGISWDNQAHCDIPTHIADCTQFQASQPIEPWFTEDGQPIPENIDATLRSLVEAFRWNFWGYSWDGGHHVEIPTHGY